MTIRANHRRRAMKNWTALTKREVRELGRAFVIVIKRREEHGRDAGRRMA